MGERKYSPPRWAQPPPLSLSEVRLQVLKGGVILGEVDITSEGRDHYLFGRQRGVVDILLEHDSVSRQHAVLQFGKDGEIFVIDLGSTHGTFVNKVKVASKEFHRVRVGDILKFGESTRLYIIDGPLEMLPEEYDSENLQRLRTEALRRAEAMRRKVASGRAGGSGGGSGAAADGGGAADVVSWGFGEDAENEDEEEEGDGGRKIVAAGDDEKLPDYMSEAQRQRRKDTQLGLHEADVVEKDRRLFERLQRKLAKVQHLWEEKERITAKESAQAGGLTAGQQAQVDRNEERIVALKVEMEEIQDTIRERNQQRKSGREKPAAGQREGTAERGGGDDDDDFFDRTAAAGGAAGRSGGGDGKANHAAAVRARRFGTGKRAPGAAAAAAPEVAAVGTAGAAAACPGAAAGSDDGGTVTAAVVETAREATAAIGRAGLTHEQLSLRRDAVVEDLSRLEAALADQQADDARTMGEAGEAAAVAAGGAAAEDETAAAVAPDPLDAFMAANAAESEEEVKKDLTNRIYVRKAELAEAERLMALTKPSLPALKPTGTVGSVRAAAADASGGGQATAGNLVNGTGRAGDAGGGASGGGTSDGSTGGYNGRNGAAVAATAAEEPKKIEVTLASEPPTVMRGQLSPPSPLLAMPGAMLPPPPRRAAAQAAASASGAMPPRLALPSKRKAAPSKPEEAGLPELSAPAAMVPAAAAVLASAAGGDAPPASPPAKKVKGPTMPPPEVLAVAKKGPVRPMMPPPPKAQTAPSTGPEGATVPPPPPHRKAAAGKAKAKTTGGPLEGGEVDWIPPSGQTGDGRTALNERLGY